MLDISRRADRKDKIFKNITARPAPRKIKLLTAIILQFITGEIKQRRVRLIYGWVTAKENPPL
jgi:hypothetical protein